MLVTLTLIYLLKISNSFFRCRVKSGLRIAGVEAANTAWNLTVEMKNKRTIATVTAMLADPNPDNVTLRDLG